MKPITIFACATALIALGGCNKNPSSDTTSSSDAAVNYANTKPPANGDWTDVINQTPSGGVMMGDPNAKTHLLEIASLGCPFCKKFEDEGAPHLMDYVKSGKISWEFRPYLIHGPIDMAAELIVRCDDPKKFFPLVRALYQDQEKWMGKVEATPQDKLQQMQNLPTNQMFVAFANLAGLQDWAAARGLPQAKSNQCLTNQKMIDREVQNTGNVNNDYPDFKGTPSFVLNGSLLPDAGSWDKLKPQLDQAIGGS